MDGQVPGQAIPSLEGSFYLKIRFAHIQMKRVNADFFSKEGNIQAAVADRQGKGTGFERKAVTRHGALYGGFHRFRGGYLYRNIKTKISSG